MNRIRRRTFLGYAGAATLLLGRRLWAAQPGPVVGRRPNVVFLLMNDAQTVAVSALGNPYIRTPNLDVLVKNGFTFNRAYRFSGRESQAARQMLLVGRSCYSPNFKDWPEQNFAKSLAEAGYFTYFCGTPMGFPRKMLEFFTSFNEEYSEKGRPRGPGGRPLREIPGRNMADPVLEFLGAWKKQKEAGQAQPFFMFLPSQHPWPPYEVPQEFIDQYDLAKIPMPAHPMVFSNWNFAEDEGPAPNHEALTRRLLRRYFASVTCLDWHIGRLFEALRQMGEFDNTIFIWTGDSCNSSYGLSGEWKSMEELHGAPGVPGLGGDRHGGYSRCTGCDTEDAARRADARPERPARRPS